MKPPDELPRCNIQLAAETLAVAFSECNGVLPSEDGRRGKGMSHCGGKSLFRKFVKENSGSVCDPEFVKSISGVGFGGFLQDPPTLLLQGDPSKLEHIRDSWSSRLLRAPAGYHIDFVGDVTRIGARPLPRGRFVPLWDAVCISIGNVTSRNDVATQEAILVELNRAFRGVHSPSRELLHETIGKLIRNRKVFCTGPDYDLVTTKTYSSKTSDEDSTSSDRHSSHECEACVQNRIAFDDRGKERRSYRSKKIREEVRTLSKSLSAETKSPLVMAVTPSAGMKSPPAGSSTTHPEMISAHTRTKSLPARTTSLLTEVISPRTSAKSPPAGMSSLLAGSTVSRMEPNSRSRGTKSPLVAKSSHSTSSATPDGESLHGSVPLKTKKRDPNSAKQEKRQRKKSTDREKRSGIIDRVTDKLFRRRRKSWSDRHISGQPNSISPERGSVNSVPMRQLSEDDARRLGYETSKSQQSTTARSSSFDKADRSEWRVMRSQSSGMRSVDTRQLEMPEQNGVRVSRSLKHDHQRISPKSQDAPDFFPETNRTGKHEIRKTQSERKANSYNSEKRRSVSGSNRFPKLRDVAVSCNLEEDFTQHSTPPPGNTTSSAQSITSYMVMTSSSRKLNDLYLRRSKSLKLPKERLPFSNACTSELIKRPPPDYSSLRKSDASPRRNGNEGMMQRSASRNSTATEHSYLHAINAAPSIRIGSVIADHLEELERRRQYWSRQCCHEMSPALSVTSSLHSFRSPDSSVASDVAPPACEKDMTPPALEEGPVDEDDPQAQNEETRESLDPETQAALKVAKRLAHLDLRMTRQEWREYFSQKVLPPEIEEALKKANQAETKDSQYESPTCFEDTSGSVETVIDVTERTSKSNSKRPRCWVNSETSEHIANSRRVSEQIANSREVSDTRLQSHEKRDEIEYATLRVAGLSPTYNGRNDNQVRSPNKWVTEQHYPVLYRCPNANSDEEYETQVFYTCDQGHRHLPYWEQHRKVAATDNASLTEDSGFHSARERASTSSWDTRRKPRGTFV